MHNKLKCDIIKIIIGDAQAILMPDYTCATLIEDIKTRIGNQEYPDEDILRYISDAQFEVLGDGKYQFLEKSFEHDGVGMGDAVLPLDFQSMVEIFIDGVKLAYVPYAKYFEHANHGEYTVFSDRVYFCVSSNNPVVHVKQLYIAKPLPMEKPEDQPYIPYEFREILTLGAMVRIERVDGNYDYAEVLRGHQDELIVNMKMRYCVRQQNMENRARLPFNHLGRI